MQLQMVENPLVLLPGLDGTGGLFAPFEGILPPEYPSAVVSYPRDYPLPLKKLLPYIRAKLPWDRTVTLVAESFSGPVALEFAAAYPSQVRAVVLVCSFVSNPLPYWTKWVQGWLHECWFKRPPSEALVRKFMLDADAHENLVTAVRDAIQSVSPGVLAERVRQVLSLDARVALQNCRKPILYLMAEQDKLIGKRGWESLSAIRVNLRTVVLEGPHLLLQRKPRECFAAIETFLKELRGNSELVTA